MATFSIVNPTAAAPTPQADILAGSQSGETITARAGDDVIYGLGGNDAIRGRSGDDIIFGQDGDDEIDGGDGDDVIYAGNGNDTVLWVTEDLSAPNTDRVYGGAGDDDLRSGNGDSLLDGGSGDDSLSDLFGGNNTMIGGPGDDSLNGTEGDDLLLGGAGIDSLSGGLHNDTLNGGGGDDELEGNAGHDLLTGGLGADTFVISSTDEGPDTIQDFSHQEGDRIRLPADVTFAGFDTNDNGVLDNGDTGVFVDPTGDTLLDFAIFDDPAFSIPGAGRLYLVGLAEPLVESDFSTM